MTDDPPAIPAATLVVMRDGEPAPEILIVERSARMAFAGEMVVFPGGRVDPADEAQAAALGRPGDGARIAAIRETLEESAVAVAMGELDPARAAGWQQALIEGETFARLIEREGLRLDLDALTPFARWKPAFHQPRRFDTMFFVTKAPPGDWHPVPQPGECTAAEWVSAASLLARIEAGEAGAIFPTKRNLERIALYASHAEAVVDAALHPLDTIVPWVEEVGGEAHVCIPAGRGYPVTSEPLATAFRA